jgi:hypothetical protein
MVVLFETIPGKSWGRGQEEGIMENSGGGEFKYILFIVRIFVNATMYPYPAQQYNKEIKKILVLA